MHIIGFTIENLDPTKSIDLRGPDFVFVVQGQSQLYLSDCVINTRNGNAILLTDTAELHMQRVKLNTSAVGLALQSASASAICVGCHWQNCHQAVQSASALTLLGCHFEHCKYTVVWSDTVERNAESLNWSNFGHNVWTKTNVESDWNEMNRSENLLLPIYQDQLNVNVDEVPFVVAFEVQTGGEDEEEDGDEDDNELSIMDID